MAKTKTTRKKRTKKARYYFTQETEDAIVEYNKLDPEKDYGKRNLLYEKKIYKPLTKMAENLIHTFKFYHFDVNSVDVGKQVTAFMTSKLDKFDPNSGKAFSYFSIVGKNWLIYHNNKNYAHKVLHRSTSGFSDASENRMNAEIARKMNKNPSESEITDYNNIIDRITEFVQENMDILWKKQRDKNIANAVVAILERRGEIETIHKKALYVLIREYSGEKTMYITKVLKTIEKYYEKIRQEYYDNKITVYNLADITF